MHTLGEIADALNASLPDDRRAAAVAGIAAPGEGDGSQIEFVADPKYARTLAITQAAAVVVGPRVATRPASDKVVVLEVADAAVAMQRALELFAPPVPRPAVGVHPSAVVAEDVALGRDVRVGPHVVLGGGVTLGHDVTLHAGVVLCDGVTVGDGTELFPHVVVRQRCTIGCRVTIHANTTIGTDGFGYRWDGKRHAKQPHIGTVVIEDDVEIGSNSCVDRGKFDETRVGGGTKIDNLVQVAHNVRIGRHCILCSGVGVAGTATLGDGVILGGGAGVKDHATLGDGARAAAFAAVPGDVAAGATVVGVPAVPYHKFMREQAALRKLPSLLKTIRDLESRLAALEGRGSA